MGNILLSSLPLLLLSAAVAFPAVYKFVFQKANAYFSYIIHHYLIWRYPICAVVDGQPMPACPYKWPNGQGDVGKFLEGEKNSKIWGSKNGRIYRIWNGMSTEVVVKDPEDIQIIFKDSDKHTKAVNNDAGWLMGELLGKCLGLISGAAYQRVKTAISPPFTHKSSLKYIKDISEVTAKHINKLSTEGKLRNGFINPVTCLAPIPFWAVANIIYGAELSSDLKLELESLIRLRESLWGHMIQGGATRFGWSRYLPTKTTRDLRDFKKRWAAFNDQAHRVACQTESQAPIRHLYAEVRNGNIEKEQLLQTIDEMLFANLDVTMGGISWCLLFLAAHEDVQEKIRQEISEARLSVETTARGWDDYIQSSSTMLAASILESSRLKPLAAFSVPQSAPTDRIVGGFLIPAGTNIIVDTHALNINNPYWDPDGETYRPARFLENRKPSEMRYHFWRFGFGPRQCLGKFTVDLLIRVVVAQLVEGYHLRLAETTRWDKNPDTWILHPDTEIRCDGIGATK
ncbi:putative cytochrome P450 monooxygenase [Annulohypoxylon maeteangense]|uniref:putative cytochrome P450 monooxygenase n=1 Tax=Annulohypoxylon maeteangense TaxID=1927788 RepID=UPI00200885D1|nr:putative cytochrome P450 monooxygenase [Annulohypoxylon maeteangense]KAI0886479.1 putative cytochrome P450 monooxygenase [Annulohypoxylon maeteangense]